MKGISRTIGCVVALGIAGCGGTTTTTTTTGGQVAVIVTSPTSGSVIAGTSVTVRGTVTPANASVQVQGKPAAVGNGVFEGSAELHGGKTTIDVIGDSPGNAPGSTKVIVVQQGSNSHGGGSNRPKSGATPAVAHASPGQSNSQTPCGGQLTVGPDTTCSFAQNVRNKYDEVGPGTYEIYSPITEKTYEMTCGQGTPVVCTGGNNASVYFP